MEPTLPDDPARWSRWLGRAFALPAAAVLATVGTVAVVLGRGDLSPWGWLYALDALALAAALMTVGARSGVGRWRRVLRSGAPGWLVLLVSARLLAFDGSHDAELVVLDREGAVVSSTRIVNRLFEERDAALVGSRLLVALGAVPAPEFPTLPELLRSSYPSVERDAARLGTPIPTTLLDGQAPDAFDAIVVRVRPQDAPTSPLGVVFLHGFAGNFALQCLEVAQSTRAVGALTVCPSTTFDGRWADAEGEATVRASIAYLRAQGAQRIVLAGISAGASGASRLAPRLSHALHGLVLISGVSSGAPTPRVPTLLIQGDHDTMVRTARVRSWARQRPGVRYRELPGTHFVLLEQREAIARELAAFLQDAATRTR